MTIQELQNKLKEMSGYWEQFTFTPGVYVDRPIISVGYKFYIDNKFYGSFFNIEPHPISTEVLSQIIKLSEVVRNNRNEYQLGPFSNPSPMNMTLL